MKILAAGQTDKGKVRSQNQDQFGVYPEAGLYLVADGMGGHAGGEVASRLAAQTIHDSMIRRTEGKPNERLLSAVQEANQAIFEAGQKISALTGMGTTIVAAVMEPSDSRVWVAHVGDSRAYLLRGDRLTQLTVDHSLVGEYVKRGLLTEREAEDHPLRHIISRALGTAPHVDADIQAIDLLPGDALLLCTDGLTNMLSAAEIKETLGSRTPEDVEGVCASLIALANAHGGIDNITMVLLRAIAN